MDVKKPLPISATASTTPRPALKKSKNNGWILGLVVVGLVAGGGVIAYRQNQQQVQKKALAQDAQTVAVTREDVQLKASASGTVAPLQSINISPKSPGRVAAVYVKEGQRVEKGQLLAQIDDSNLRGQLAQAEGQLSQAQATYKKALAGFRKEEINQSSATLQDVQAALTVAQSNYEQDQSLFQQGAISERVVDNSRAQRDRAQAQLESARQSLTLRQNGNRPEDIAIARAQVETAQGNLQTVRIQIADYRLRAPMSGVVTRIYADPGSIVSPSTPSSNLNSSISSSVMNLAGELIAKANVAETDVVRIRPGLPVAIHADAYPGKTFQGQVREVAPQSTVVQNVTSFEVKVTLLPPANTQLRSGMNVDADFLTGQVPQALMVPTVAIVRQASLTGVYIKDAKGQPQFRAIKPGINTSSNTQVMSGLQVGDQVFISFPPGFRPDTAKSSLPGGSLRGTVR
ncbi:MAG: biotin/lipoyl-binding protein [Anaerolineae bacterium]|nr:biotin/lipoyl-binding protein [Gloeobacterales cyanobacterium ES-bin-313]